MLKIAVVLSGLVISLGFSSSVWAQMSSASSESTCTTSGSVKRIFAQNEHDRLHHFVEQNYARLQEDAAKGSGILLSDYVRLLGCSHDTSIMSQAIQKNYSHLFSEGQAGLVHKTAELMESHPELMLACG